MRKLIGNMDRKVTIQQRAVTKDGYGGQTESFADLYTVWAEYTPQAMTGVALTEMSDQPQMLEKATFTIRWKSVPTDARLVYDNHIWKIIGMAEIGRKDRLQINAVKTDSTLFGDTAVDATIGTTGKTLTELIAQDEANETELTVGQLSDYYIAQNTVAPRIAYPRVYHVDNHAYIEGSHPYGYDDLLPSLSDPYPSNILHIAEVDVAADQEYLATLVNNNEFGNKHRFTYDDGTKATEAYAASVSVLTTAATDDGYTGSNPQYIIDHLTGLGYHRCGLETGVAEWYDARQIYEAGFTSGNEMNAAINGLTIHGFSDWRCLTHQEYLYSLHSQDYANFMSGATTEEDAAKDIYFPPLNTYLRAFGGRMLTLGPIDLGNQSLTSTFTTYWPYFQGNSGQWSVVSDDTLVNNWLITNDYVIPILVRRHYTNQA